MLKKPILSVLCFFFLTSMLFIPVSGVSAGPTISISRYPAQPVGISSISVQPRITYSVANDNLSTYTAVTKSIQPRISYSTVNNGIDGITTTKLIQPRITYSSVSKDANNKESATDDSMASLKPVISYSVPDREFNSSYTAATAISYYPTSSTAAQTEVSTYPSSANTEPKTDNDSENNKYLENLENYEDYLKEEIPVVESFRASFNNSLAQAIVGRAIWYMEYGYMVYGHEKYPSSGLIDCSNFVSLVYKDFGYDITSAARKYNTVGEAVEGVYSRLQPGSSTRYELVGLDKLKAGDIMTFWKEDSSGKRYIGHVAIYMGKIDGKPTIIHTAKDNPTAIGITNNFSWWYGEHFNDVRRVLGSSAYISNFSKTLPDPVIPEEYKITPQGPIILPADLPYGF